MQNYILERVVKNRAEWEKSIKGRKSTLDCSATEKDGEDACQWSTNNHRTVQMKGKKEFSHDRHVDVPYCIKDDFF